MAFLSGTAALVLPGATADDDGTNGRKGARPGIEVDAAGGCIGLEMVIAFL